jgi:hypothetical protein
MIFAVPEDVMATVLLPHMAVILASLYMIFTGRKWKAPASELR